MGGHPGDPYTIGGKRGISPQRASRECILSPSRGCPWVAPGYGSHGTQRDGQEPGVAAENPGGSPTNGACPQGGGPMAPRQMGGGRFKVSVLVLG